jgi:hypothetical protein
MATAEKRGNPATAQQRWGRELEARCEAQGYTADAVASGAAAAPSAAEQLGTVSTGGHGKGKDEAPARGGELIAIANKKKDVITEQIGDSARVYNDMVDKVAALMKTRDALRHDYQSLLDEESELHSMEVNGTPELMRIGELRRRVAADNENLRREWQRRKRLNQEDESLRKANSERMATAKRLERAVAKAERETNRIKRLQKDLVFVRNTAQTDLQIATEMCDRIRTVMQQKISMKRTALEAARAGQVPLSR